jgi:hypothetical protein
MRRLTTFWHATCLKTGAEHAAKYSGLLHPKQWDAMRQRARYFVETKRGSQINVYLYDPVYHSLLQHNETVNAA